MNSTLRQDAENMIRQAIDAAEPGFAVRKALKGRTFPGRVFLIATGKAAWKMAWAARGALGRQITGGVVVTKYGHAEHALSRITCYEGGHPVPDAQGVAGTQAALELTRDLQQSDTVLFLLSGGGSALFEKPLIPLHELQEFRVRTKLADDEADLVTHFHQLISTIALVHVVDQGRSVCVDFSIYDQAISFH